MMSSLLSRITGKGNHSAPSQQSAPQNPREIFEVKMAKTPLGKSILSAREIIKNNIEGEAAEGTLDKAFTAIENTTIGDSEIKLWATHRLEELILSAHGGIRPRITNLVKKLRGF